MTGLNTAAEHGRRGRRVEYSIGWPVDARTMGAVTRLPKDAWTDAVTAEGTVDPDACWPSPGMTMSASLGAPTTW